MVTFPIAKTDVRVMPGEDLAGLLYTLLQRRDEPTIIRVHRAHDSGSWPAYVGAPRGNHPALQLAERPARVWRLWLEQMISECDRWEEVLTAAFAHWEDQDGVSAGGAA
ncbi:hypothetical protein D9M70_462250 [compost metagenome]